MPLNTPGNELWTKCVSCGVLYPKNSWDSGRGTYTPYPHTCDVTKTVCGECGIDHEGYSAESIGYSPCLRALQYEIEQLRRELEKLNSSEMLYHLLRQVDP